MLNKLKEAIEEKQCAIGTFLGAANPSIVEIMGYTGLDFVVIDTEHGPYDTMPMSDLIQAAESKGISPLVRIADITHKEMQRALDNGAEGIIIPCLKSIDDFRTVVELGMTFTTTPAEARMYIDKGFDAVAYSIDTIVIGQAYKSAVEQIRG